MCKRTGYSSTPISSVLSNPERLPCIGSIHILLVSAWRGASVFPQLPIQSLWNRRMICRVPRNHSGDFALTAGIAEHSVEQNLLAQYENHVVALHRRIRGSGRTTGRQWRLLGRIDEIWSCSVERDLESPACTSRSWRRSCTVLPDFFAQAACRELRCQYPFTAPALVIFRKIHKF